MKKQKELKTESGWKILDERMAVDLSGLDDQKSKEAARAAQAEEARSA